MTVYCTEQKQGVGRKLPTLKYTTAFVIRYCSVETQHIRNQVNSNRDEMGLYITE